MTENKSVSGEEILIDEGGVAIEVEEGKLMSHVAMTQKIKTQQPWALQGILMLPPQQTSHTRMHPYCPAKRVELASKFSHKGSKSITRWLLCL